MNKRASDILEYNKIIEMLSGEACSQMAKDRIADFTTRSLCFSAPKKAGRSP